MRRVEGMRRVEVVCALVCVLSLVLTAGANVAYAVPVNMLTNGELDNSWGVLNGPGSSGSNGGWNWSISGGVWCYIWSESGMPTPTHIYSGTNAVRMCTASNTAGTSDVYIWQVLPVVSGMTYVGSAYAYNYQSGPNQWTSGDYAGMWIEELDANKNVISGAGSFDMYGAASTNWISFSRTIKLDPKTCFVRFKLGAHISAINGDASPNTREWITWDKASFRPDQSSANWNQYRGDRRLTGRSPLKGNITTPTQKWSKFIGGRETVLGIRFGSSSGSASLPTSNSGSVWQTKHDWGCGIIGGYYENLDGDGQYNDWVVPDTQTKIGDFRTYTGLEKVHFDGNFGGNSYGHQYKRSAGSWVLEWTTPDAIAQQQTCNTIVGDFDNDGALEIAQQRWHYMQVRSITTGAQEYTECKFTPASWTGDGRGYGWFGAIDCNNDGKKEFICLGDYQNFVSVVGWSGSTLTRLWDKSIEESCTNKQTQHSLITNPVEDVDGDGQKEVVVCVYNWDPDNTPVNDGVWHVIVFNAMTGAVKADWENKFLYGLSDINLDGSVDLFMMNTSGMNAPEIGNVGVYSFLNQSLSMFWSVASGGLQMQPIKDFPLNVNSSAASIRGTLLSASTATTAVRSALLCAPIASGGRPVWVTRSITDDSAGTVKLEFWQHNGTSVVSIGTVTGPNAEALQLRIASGTDPRAIVGMTVPLNESKTYSYTNLGAAGTVLGSQLTSLYQAQVSPTTPIVARLNASDTYPTVIVEGVSQRTIAFEGSTAGTKKWELPGRGMYMGANLCGDYANGGQVLGDFDGNGVLDVLLASRNPSTGCARLIARKSDGTALWNYDFTNSPGALPTWTKPGLTMWFVGDFDSYDQNDDVMVCVRRSLSDETWMLRGSTGALQWTRTTGGYSGQGVWRTCGGYWMASYDHDSDGYEDALCMYPDVIFVMNGPNGSLLLEEDTNEAFSLGRYEYTAVPVVDNYLADGTRAWLYGGQTNILGVLYASTGLEKWSVDWSGYTPNTPGVLCNIDNDDALELLCPGFADGTLRCYNPDTGSQEWYSAGWSVHNNAGGPVSCDINNDGKGEILFTVNNILYCMGTNASGTNQLKWSWTGPSGYTLSSPAIADANNDGYAEVIMTCNNGYVYCIGQ